MDGSQCHEFRAAGRGTKFVAHYEAKCSICEKNEKIEKSEFDPKNDSKSYVFKHIFTKRLILGDPGSSIPRCAMFG